MSAILPFVHIDSGSLLARYFTPYQIAWIEAEDPFHEAKKHDLGFALMNQLSVAEKRFPKTHQDIAADYFALRKTFNGNRWAFTEGPNSLNPASHCDIAWAGALATHAHTESRCDVWAAVAHPDCWFDGRTHHPYSQ